jgi:hypothetical protein
MCRTSDSHRRLLCFNYVLCSFVWLGNLVCFIHISPFTGTISVYWFRVIAKSDAYLQNFLDLASFEILTAVNLRV